MSGFLADLSLFFNQSVTWLGVIVKTVVAEPALMICVFGMPIVGFASGLLGRLIRL